MYLQNQGFSAIFKNYLNIKLIFLNNSKKNDLCLGGRGINCIINLHIQNYLYRFNTNMEMYKIKLQLGMLIYSSI